MYIPYGKNIRCNDVNSLLTTYMKNNEFPIGD